MTKLTPLEKKAMAITLRIVKSVLTVAAIAIVPYYIGKWFSLPEYILETTKRDFGAYYVSGLVVVVLFMLIWMYLGLVGYFRWIKTGKWQ